jgi:DNA/RNA-binding domain of Phe-tRNA-synthetase-like protein
MTAADGGTFPKIHLAPELERCIRAGRVGASPVEVRDASPELLAEIRSLEDGVRARWRGRAPAEIDALRPARDLYRAFGIDPTKNRPSSEALLRRILKGDELPRISNAVDIANYLAVRFMLPLGLYDADRLAGRVELRRGRAGESYPGIRKKEIHLQGRPVVADEQGPFGNPTSDSARTAVGPGTRSLLLVVFAPAAFSSERLDGFVEEAVDAFRRHLGRPSELVGDRIDGMRGQ